MAVRLPVTLDNADPKLLALAAAVAAITCAGVLWLHQASDLATTGQRIYELDLERRALLERRAEALVAYAAATDPHRLEARATALGLGPMRRVEPLAVAASPDAARTAALAPDSPLAITQATAAAGAPADSLTERLLSLALSEAAASERDTPDGIGGGR